MGKRERDKGAAAEREASSLLTRLLGVAVKRLLGQTRDSGADFRIGSVVVEVKRQERASLHTWLNQAEAAKGPGDVAAVMWRPSRRGWVVCMAVEDWANLARAAGLGGDGAGITMGSGSGRAWDGNVLGFCVDGRPDAMGPDSGHPGPGHPGDVAVGDARREVASE